MKKFKITIKDLEENKTIVDEETDGIMGAILKGIGETRQIFLTACSGIELITLVDGVEETIKEAKEDDPMLKFASQLLKAIEDTKKDED